MVNGAQAPRDKSIGRRKEGQLGLPFSAFLIQAGNESLIKRYIETFLGKLIEYDRKKAEKPLKPFMFTSPTVEADIEL